MNSFEPLTRKPRPKSGAFGRGNSHWINEGHEAILWLSGITGLSSTVIIILILGFGKEIAHFVINVLRIVLIVALVLFLLSLYVRSGHVLPDFTMSTGIGIGLTQ